MNRFELRNFLLLLLTERKFWNSAWKISCQILNFCVHFLLVSSLNNFFPSRVCYCTYKSLPVDLKYSRLWTWKIFFHVFFRYDWLSNDRVTKRISFYAIEKSASYNEVKSFSWLPNWSIGLTNENWNVFFFLFFSSQLGRTSKQM